MPEIYRTRFSAMGGSNEIVCGGVNQDKARQAMESATAEVLRIERKYSRYRAEADSIVFQINSSAGTSTWTPCDEETWQFFTFANQIHQLSSGLFDITSGVLRKAWDFKAAVTPAPETLASLLPLVNWPLVELRDKHVRLPIAGMEIDFGGFGKEYAAGRAAQILTNSGIVSGFVNLSGDIAAIGPQENGDPWSIGVQHPRKPSELLSSIKISKGGLATSGDYERYFIKDGVRYSHILNPKTGYPTNCWSSVSVSGEYILWCGVYSTIAMLKETSAEQFLSGTGYRYLLADLEGGVVQNRN